MRGDRWTLKSMEHVINVAVRWNESRVAYKDTFSSGFGAGIELEIVMLLVYVSDGCYIIGLDSNRFRLPPLPMYKTNGGLKVNDRGKKWIQIKGKT